MTEAPFKRTLCFGGSFNPPHIGHLRCGLDAASAGGFDRLLLIPTADVKLKLSEYQLAGGIDRLAMLRISAVETPSTAVRVGVDSTELDRPPPSFTIQTARHFRRVGWSEVNWLIGADQLLTLPRWHAFEDLMREVNFYVLDRPGYAIDWAAVHPLVRPLRDKLLPAPLVPVSATDIRQRVADNLSIEGLVTPGVERYIRQHGLYRPAATAVKLEP